MCVAIPAEIVELLPGGMARVSVGGAEQVACLALVGPAQVGAYVLLHVGFALSLIDPDEAMATIATLRELAGYGPAPGQDASP
jgi:hydrogenase expression/formation protein HypC